MMNVFFNNSNVLFCIFEIYKHGLQLVLHMRHHSNSKIGWEIFNILKFEFVASCKTD